MKKLSFFLLSLMAVTLFTACGNDEPGKDPDNKQTVTSTMNYRAINGDNVVFSQSSAKVELNYSDMLIKFTGEFKDASGQTRSLTTPDMPMTALSSSVYRFNSASAAATGISNLEGYIDFISGVMWYTFDIDATTQVVCSTQLLYIYTITKLSNPENGNTGSHQQSAYLFALDNKGEKCTLKISNFMANLNGTVEAPEVEYNDLTVTPTATGFTITADEVESNYRGFYTLTDVNFVIDNQCKEVHGTFKCKDLEYVVDGGLFTYTE